MESNSKILVTGADGMAGSAVVRELRKQGYNNIVAVDRREYNLIDTISVRNLFSKENPEYVFHIAAKVGGIQANNTQSADFIYENLMMQCNVIETTQMYQVKKLLFCGSACIYPKTTPMPIKEEYLLTGLLEETNKAYAIAKIAGVIMCQMYRKQYGCNFIAAMPTNLYGPGDNFNLNNSHVMPALLRKFYEASEKVEIWGSGKPRREFLYVDDLANALVFLMNKYNQPEPINVGTGIDVSIMELVELIKTTIGYKGQVVYNSDYPDGVFERRLDVSKLYNLGWVANTSLSVGVKQTWDWFIKNKDTIRR